MFIHPKIPSRKAVNRLSTTGLCLHGRARAGGSLRQTTQCWESGSSSRQQHMESSNQEIKQRLWRSWRLYSFICSARSDNTHHLACRQHNPSVSRLGAAVNEGAGSESQEISAGNQHVTVLLSPSGKGRNKQNPRHPLTSMEKN